MRATAKYHDSDVPGVFPGFTPPARDNILNMSEWNITPTESSVDGIVQVFLNGSVLLSFSPESARELGRELIHQADLEDAKIEDDEDGDDLEDLDEDDD